jgi:hypothetical protein
MHESSAQPRALARVIGLYRGLGDWTQQVRAVIGWAAAKRRLAGDPLRLGPAPFAALFAVLALLASLPVLLTGTLPLADYPNHLARMHILSALPLSNSLQRYYEVNWQVLPNLAMDLVIPPLARWLPLVWAGKVFVVLTLCLLAGGAALLHRVLFGSWSAWSCLAFLLLLSHTLLWGSINYLFGVGASLAAFALWIALYRRPVWLRLALGTVLALGVFFAHLLAFGFYGAMVAGYELGVILRERPPIARALRALIVGGAPFLPPLAALLLLTPGTAGGPIEFNHIGRKFELFFEIFDNYNTPFDLASLALAVFALALAFWRRWIILHPAIAMPLGLFLLAYLTMPSLIATSAGADRKAPVMLALVLVAGSRWTAPTARSARAFMGVAFLLFMVRTGVVAAEWRQSDLAYAQLLPALDKVPIGSRIAITYPQVKCGGTTLFHFPTLAVSRRDAFVPTLFANPTQQPIALRPQYRALAGQLSPWRLWDALVKRTAPLNLAERAALADYDFIVFVGQRPFAQPAEKGLSPLVTTPHFVLARIDAVSAR